MITSITKHNMVNEITCHSTAMVYEIKGESGGQKWDVWLDHEEMTQLSNYFKDSFEDDNQSNYNRKGKLKYHFMSMRETIYPGKSYDEVEEIIDNIISGL